MNIAVPKEVHEGETRVSMIPEHVAKLVQAGAEISWSRLLVLGVGADGHQGDSKTEHQKVTHEVNPWLLGKYRWAGMAD